MAALSDKQLEVLAAGREKRGKLRIPEHVSPLVRQFYQLANKDMTTLTEVHLRSGVSLSTLRSWRTQSAPFLDNFIAALNAFGYDLRIVPMDREKPGPKPKVEKVMEMVG